MTTQTDFADLIGTLEDNLQAMGVSDAEFDSTTGIMGLVARILDIEPTFALSDVSMDLTLSVPSTANINVPVTLSATLIGSYDDTQTSNVDLLTAEMRGATIEFYNGNTLIGTAITNENGIATLQYTPSAIGTHVITAIFNGTDIWENATSNTAYLEVESLTITSSSNIVSVGDTITLTATYLDSTGTGIENESIDFIDCSDDSIIGTATTDSNGQCTVSYSVQDSEPLYIKAKCGIILSETSEIIIYLINDDATSSAGLSNFGTPYRFRGSSGSITLTHDTNKYKGVINNTSAVTYLWPITVLQGITDFKLEMELYNGCGTNSGFGFGMVNDSSNYFSIYSTYTRAIMETSVKTGESSIDTTRASINCCNAWKKFEIIVDSTNEQVTLKVYDMNGNLNGTITRPYRISIADNTMIGISQGWQSGNTSYIKNIKAIKL